MRTPHKPEVINYTSSGETSAATRNNAPSSPPVPVASTPHNHLRLRIFRPYRRHIRVPRLWRELIHRHSIALFPILHHPSYIESIPALFIIILHIATHAVIIRVILERRIEAPHIVIVI